MSDARIVFLVCFWSIRNASCGSIVVSTIVCPPAAIIDRATRADRGCAKANGRAVATRRLGVTSGTGAAAGALFASGTKESAAEDEQT
jgi:hypothetical protein